MVIGGVDSGGEGDRVLWCCKEGLSIVVVGGYDNGGGDCDSGGRGA